MDHHEQHEPDHRLKATVATSRPVSTADIHAPTSNTAAVVTYAARPSRSHVISGIAWSYNADPTAGNLKIEDGAGSTVFSMDVTVGGAGFIVFPEPKKGSVNTLMRITLAAGGSGVSGKVSILNHWME